MQPGDLTVVLLAGGMGTRIRGLHPNLPKPMIPVANLPFIEWLFRYWGHQGFKRFIVSVGYRAEAVQQYLTVRQAGCISILSVSEQTPLGTAGALLNAAAVQGCSDPVIVANGDSLVVADLAPALPILSQPDVDGLMLVVEVPDAARFGTVEIGSEGVLAGFQEKKPGRGFINAGVYAFKRRVLDLFPESRPLSLEADVFPLLLRSGVNIKVIRAKGPFLDIGTPESLALADEFVVANLSEF